MPGQALPLLVVSALLLCANPTRSSTEEGGDLAEAVRVSAEAASREPTRLAGISDASARPVVASSPLPAGYEVGSHYGYRTSTRTGRRTFHAGVDFLGPRGTPVYAVRGGVVESVAEDAHPSRRWNGYGNAVVIRHPRLGVWSFYAHLDSVRVEEGQVVEPGEPIGAVGNTTNGRFPYMVPHLHLEVRRAKSNGESPFPGAYRQYNLDPEEWLASLGVRYDHADASEDTAQPVLVVDSCDHDHDHAPTARN